MASISIPDEFVSSNIIVNDLQIINEYATLKRTNDTEFQYVYIYWFNDEPRILYRHAKDDGELYGPEISCPMSFIEKINRLHS